jgi:S1-C subfamily serine protease
VAGPWRSWGGGQFERFVRLDGGLYPGMMGAPVADASGQVLGIASAALSRHHGVVVPWETIDRVAEALLAHGRVPRGHLGIAMQPVALSAEMRSAAGLETTTGLLVSVVGEGSPAARAGLLVGDILVGAAGRPVGSLDALRSELGADRIGTTLALIVLRGGARQALSVEVGERPSESRC